MCMAKTSGFNWDNVNINGRACAHGHTLSTTGAMLMTKLVNELEYNEKNIDYKQCALIEAWLLLLKNVIKHYHRVIFFSTFKIVI